MGMAAPVANENPRRSGEECKRMNLLQTNIEKILKILSSTPTVAAQKEHLDWLKDQIQAIQKKMSYLEEENAKLIKENESLSLELSSFKNNDEYIDIGVCSLKKSPHGGYFPEPLCPSCKKPLSPFSNGKFFVCSSCVVKIDSKAIRAALMRAEIS